MKPLKSSHFGHNLTMKANLHLCHGVWRHLQFSLGLVVAVSGTTLSALGAMYTTAILDFSGASSITPYSINAAGEIVGSYVDGGGVTHGFSYSGGVVKTIDVPGFAQTTAQFINDSGQITGRSLDTPIRNFIDVGGTFTVNQYQYPGASYTQISGINNHGLVIGDAADSTGTFGWVYSGGTYTKVGYGSYGLGLTGINDAGQIVGSYEGQYGYRHGFFYNLPDHSIHLIDIPGAYYIQTWGMNNAGVVAGVLENGSGPHGFLYQGGTAEIFNVPGATWSQPIGINSQGIVVGDYLDGTGVHAFVATPVAVPESTSSLPMLVASAGAFLWAGFRRRGLVS